jgi:DNA-binding CsgD family transcriptional regulator
MRLSHRDADGVLRILPELYALRRPMQFFETSLSLLHQLVICDHCEWFVYDYTSGVRLTTAVESDRRLTPRLATLIEQALPSHPQVRHYASTRDAPVVILSDLPSRERLEHRWQFDEIYRHFDMDHQISTLIVSNPQMSVGLGFQRKAHDFTERDRTLVNLLQPHLQRAYANALIVDPGEDATAVSLECAEAFGFTAREAQVAFWMAEGKTNAEIALILGMATRTVEKHVEHLLTKMAVENRTTFAIQIRSWLSKYAGAAGVDRAVPDVKVRRADERIAADNPVPNYRAGLCAI